MVMILSVLIILGVAYAHHREGLFTALCLLVNVFLAGVLTFEFGEPLADILDANFQGGAMSGTEDFLVLVALFTLFFSFLRLATNNLAFKKFQLEPNLTNIGGGVVGLVTGYLVAGFLVVVLQTLPWHQNFMGFAPRTENEGALRSYLPPDRIWLALMRHVGANNLCWGGAQENMNAESNYDRYVTFDTHGTFELRFVRYRRYGDYQDPSDPNKTIYINPRPYQGEFEVELGRKK